MYVTLVPIEEIAWPIQSLRNSVFRRSLSLECGY